jgi:hypothetical protein
MRNLALERATEFARLDKRLNGNYINSPYSVFDENGVLFKGYVRQWEKGKITLELIRPAECTGTETLETPHDCDTATPAVRVDHMSAEELVDLNAKIDAENGRKRKRSRPEIW